MRWSKKNVIIAALSLLFAVGCGEKAKEANSSSKERPQPGKAERNAGTPGSEAQPPKAIADENAKQDEAEANQQPTKSVKPPPAIAKENPTPKKEEAPNPPAPPQVPIIQDIPTLKNMAAQGDAQAQLSLGDKYSAGDGVPRDLPEAAKLYRQAAEQGLPGAAYNLAMMYDSGFGVDKDPEEAAKWYRKADENRK